MTKQLDRDLRNTFNQVAAEYDAVRPTYPSECIDSILEYSKINYESNVLEIGSGTGQASQLFIERGFGVTGLDIGSDLIEFAKAKFQNNSRVKFEVTSFEDFTSDQQPFDLIFSATAFHWVDPVIRFKKAAELLCANGTLALFWNIDRRIKSPLRVAIDNVYERVLPSEPNDSGRQSDFETATEAMIDEMKKCGLFSNVQIKKQPWQVEFSKEKYLRLLNTFSYHRSLSGDLRTKLLNGIDEAIEGFGGTITINYENVLVLGTAV